MGSGKTKKLHGNTICYGDSRPLPRAVSLRAGPLRMNFEEGTLRAIYLGEREILKQIYAAVRDPNWLTVPGEISRLRIERTRNSFRIRYRSTHRVPPVHFIWDARIEGSPSGSLHFDMDGVARSTFKRARIGLCVLHPSESCAGLDCEVLRVRNAQEIKERTAFPTMIDPSAPAHGFQSMSGMEYAVAPGVRMRLRFSGDLFETEDQRNWTDASFKTFSTPLHLPMPVTVEQGAQVRQSVSLKLLGEVSAPILRAQQRVVTLSLGSKPLHNLPSIGLGCASHHQPLSKQEEARLSGMGLSHLRFDLDCSSSTWTQELEIAASGAKAVAVPLEVAILNHADGLTQEILSALRRSEAGIERWLLFPNSARLARQLKRAFPGVPVGSGTNANFISFAERPPKSGHLDFAAFAIHPQTHATDNTSLVETLQIQKALVLEARRLTAGLPVVVSPVTLKARFNPDAIGPEKPTAEGELPPQVDTRQMSLFGAAWTLGSIRYLAEAGASSVTYYETTGWRGVMEREQGAPLPNRFPSLPGAVFPLYFVFAWLHQLRHGKVLPLSSSSPLKVNGLAVRRGTRTRLVLANFTGAVQTAAIIGAPEGARAIVLDESKTTDAMYDPARLDRCTGLRITNGSLRLPRYSLARIDF